MDIGFVYPCDYMKHGKVDEMWAQEADAFREAGYPVFLANVDELGPGSVLRPPPQEALALVYRGWMLNAESYAALEAAARGRLWVGRDEYLASHHLPNWIGEIGDLTFETVVATEAEAPEVFAGLGWGKAFVKDYVKSLKTGKGSVVESPQDLVRAISDMKAYRGFIEGGIVLRRACSVEDGSEVRFFVLDGEVYAPPRACEQSRALAREAAARRKSKFFSVDVARVEGGKLVVVEVGDGQESDTVGWPLESFVDIFSKLSGISCSSKV